MIKQFAESIIDRVHKIWESNKEIYPAGYAVFYGPVRFQPDLMLIGMNPGGTEEDFNGRKEDLFSIDQSMEYLQYQNDHSYPIAGKTVNVFKNAGLLPFLEHSVKTNLNFFRSKKWSNLPKNHSAECLQLTSEMIEKIKPKVIFCESIFVFDAICRCLSKKENQLTINQLVKSHGKRRYVSCVQKSQSNTLTIIGISHLTGSRLSGSEVALIEKNLSEDFQKI